MTSSPSSSALLRSEPSMVFDIGEDDRSQTVASSSIKCTVFLTLGAIGWTSGVNRGREARPRGLGDGEGMKSGREGRTRGLGGGDRAVDGRVANAPGMPPECSLVNAPDTSTECTTRVVRAGRVMLSSGVYSLLDVNSYKRGGGDSTPDLTE
jgi:hypothetical protein